jgi:hypothetical protein
MTRKKKRKLALQKAADDRAARAPRVAWKSFSVEILGTSDYVVNIAAGMFHDGNRAGYPTLAEALPPHPQYAIDTMKVISEAVAAAEHETYGEALSNLQCDHVGINSSGELELATHKRMPLTITATPPTEEQRQNREAPTITINGEQVPATITKDPTA